MARPRGFSPTQLFAVLFGINVLNYADRYTLPAVAPLIAASLHLGDAELGRLGTAFLLVYALAALPLGVLADRSRRTGVAAGGVAVWSLATALTGLCSNAAQLFAVRALLGIGEASYFPAANSLLADAFPPERRARIMSLWGGALPVGVFLGFAVGGFVGQHFGWRSAFFVVGIPGLILATLTWFQREPRRGQSEGLTAQAAGVRGHPLGLQVLRTPTVAFSIVAQAFAYFVLGGLSFWVTVYLNRHYHLDTASAGLAAGALFVLGGGVGTVAGGYFADRLLPSLPSARLVVPGVGFIASGIGIACSLMAPSLAWFLVAYGISGAFLSLYTGPMTALLQDVVAPAARARAVALSLLLAHLFGDALSPTLIGWLSDALGGAAGGGLDKAFWITVPASLAAGVVALAGCRYVQRDRATMVAAHVAHRVPAAV